MNAWPTADEIALDELRSAWGAVYEIETADGGYRAEYALRESPPLTAATLEGLGSAIRAHWSRQAAAGGVL